MNEQNQAPVAYEEADEISLLDLLQVIADNLRLLIIVPLLSGLVAFSATFVIKPTFTATTTFLPPQQQQSAAASMLQSLGTLGGVASLATGLKNPADQYVALTGSRSVKDALIEKFKLVERYDEKYRQDARKELEKNSRISAGKNGLITVEVDDHEPQIAAEMANAYVEELSRLMGRLALTEAQERRAFFEGQLKKAKEGLTTSEAALKATGISESAVKASPGASVGAVASLMAQVAAKEVQISAMRGYLVESAPEFQRAQAELGALRSQLSRSEKDTASRGAGGDYVAKYRDFKYFETLYELMAKQYEIARIDESREGAVIQVVDKAIAPERKSKPKRSLVVVLATVVAGILLLLFVFFRQALRNAQNVPDSAQKLYGLQSSFRRALGKT